LKSCRACLGISILFEKHIMHLILIALAFAVFFSACGDSDSSSALYNTDIEYGALTDARDGQTYRTVPIGNQVWMAENLKYASDASFCYGDDPEYCKKYGRLYTWNDAQDVCPAGWHLPNRAEWWTLVANVGGRGEAMHALKSTSVWVSMRDTSAVATDSYGFSILPTGYKDVNKGYVFDNQSHAVFWTASEDYANDANAFYFYMGVNYGPGLDSTNKLAAFTVRCLQDSPDAELREGSLTDERDGQIYKTVVIGTQTWMAENLNYATDSSMCYQNKPEYCDEYGRLYKWIDAQNACPAGWHLPDTTDWNKLFYAVADVGLAGEVLKTIPYWERDSWAFRELRDLYGFSALPAGIWDSEDPFYLVGADRDGSGQFLFVKERAFFWTATEGLDNMAYQVQISRYNIGAYMAAYYDKSNAFSIRCVKD
jgi:uncharacterized protein (TIGR02145 family)